MFDANKPGDTEKAVQAGTEVMRVCAEVGGALSGEHGIGVEKIDMMCFVFKENDLDIMRRVHDAYDTGGYCNPGKLIPTPGRCGETRPAAPGKAQETYVREGIGQAW